MSARQAVDTAIAAGIKLEIEGEKLIAEFDGQIPDAVVADLKRHKAEILSLLRPGESVTAAPVCAKGPATVAKADGAAPPARPSPIDIAAAHHLARIAEKEAELARQDLGPDGTTPLDEYRRLAAKGAKSWQNAPPLPDIDIPASPPSPSRSWPEPKIRTDPPFGSDKVPSRYEAGWKALLAEQPSWCTEAQWLEAICGCRDLFGEWGAELLHLNWQPENIFDRWHGLAWFLKGGAVTAIGPYHAFLQDGRIFERQRR
jgi:hypothetical protein